MAEITTATATAPSVSSLEKICSIEDIFHRHLLPLLSYKELGRLEQTSKSLSALLTLHDSVCWNILRERDFHYYGGGDGVEEGISPKAAPVYSQERSSFDSLVEQTTHKTTYQKWNEWDRWMHGGAEAQHMVESIYLWKRLKTVLQTLSIDNILQSFSPCPDPSVFEHLVQKESPSSLLAFYAVHGGQVGLQARSQDHEFFAGLFGSYSCYNDFYSMRLLNIADFMEHAVTNRDKSILIGMSPGNPRMFLFLKPSEEDPQGVLHMVRDNPVNLSIREHLPVVGHGGILQYFREYVKRLETGYYKPETLIDTSPSSMGISLFPDAGDNVMSRRITRGIEVRASARWFPAGIMEQYQEGLNFGYSIRIRRVVGVTSSEDDIPAEETCQLVSRHWEFQNGNGSVRRVDGEAVIGKQPLFFVQDGNSGFIDLGPAGDGETYRDKTFVYRSQSGPVAGTTQGDTGVACVKGTFGFVPGSIENPKGPLFHVMVGTFPLSIPYPFY